MADNIIEDPEVSDICNQKNNDGVLIYGPYGSDKRSYNKLSLVSIAIICLLFGLLFGLLAGDYIYQQLFKSISDSSAVSTAPNNINDVLSIDGVNPDGSEFGIGGFGNNGNINIKRKRAARKNEAECSARKCCNIRDDLTTADLPLGLVCESLTDEECGENNTYCEWDCEGILERIRRKKKFSRKYRGISLFQGTWQEPGQGINNGIGLESYEQCLSEGKLLEVDDCGVEYETELDLDELKKFCKLRENADASFKNGKSVVKSLQDSDRDYGEEGEEGNRRLVVLGTDDRIQVTSTSYPWRTVLFLIFEKPGGSKFRCTATMISPRWAITAAHCVWGNGDWYSNFKLYKNVVNSCSDINSGNEFIINGKGIFASYQTNQNSNNDIAILRLTIDPGLDYLDFGYDSTFSGTSSFNIISHPADKPDCTKWRQYCPYNTWFTSTQRTEECDTFGGASGSGVYKYWSSSIDRIIFAIHSSTNPGGGYNTATRITSGRYNVICNFVELNDPNHCDNEHNKDKFG